MAMLRNFTLFLLLLSVITLSQGNEKIYDTYLNGHCYWTEDVSYHVHYSSGCKVYFTCQRGKFLDFHRCPESTVFNTKTLQCDTNGICEDYTSDNPAYVAWWKTVAEVIDEVLEVLETKKENSGSNPDRIAQFENTISVAVHPSSTVHLVENIKPTDCGQLSVDATNNLKGTLSLPVEAVSTSYCTKEIDSSNTVAKIPNLNTEAVQCDANGVCELGGAVQCDSNGVCEFGISVKPSQSTATSSETKQTSAYTVPIQLDTQTLKTEIFSSYVTPKALLHEDMLKAIDQLDSSYLEAFAFSSNLTKEKKFMKDFIFPIVQDIVKNSTIISKINQLFDALFESADPVLYQILDQKVDEELGSSITISLKDIKDAFNRATFLVYPIVKEILRYTSSLVLGKAAENTEVLLDFFERDDIKIMENIPSLFGSFLDLFFKYRLLNKPSTSDQLTSYSLIEIRKDMKGVFEILSEMIGKKAV